MAVPQALLSQFEAAFGRLPVVAASAPGRVNLIGEHVDYSGGLALPCAIDRSAWFLLAPNHDDVVEIEAADLGQAGTFHLADLTPPRAVGLAGWARYPAGVGWSLRQAGYDPAGLQGLVSSSVPIGSGLSSSAAVEVACAVGWLALAGIDIDPLGLARVCQRAENEFVGVASGLLDQWTALAARQDHALLLDFGSFTCEAVPLPTTVSLVIADSGVVRQLAEAGYNQRVAECSQALALLRTQRPDLVNLSELTTGEAARLAAGLPEPLDRRVRHVADENERVRQAVAALRAGDSERMGRLLLAGHESLRDLYQVSHPKLDALVEMALECPGCYGARMTGAGFGGSTINWVARDRAEAFAAELRRRAKLRLNHELQVWICQPAGGAQAIRLDG
jgi:galactokinase